MQFRNFVRRHKWRLRPLKGAVLPLRNLRRALVELRRTPPGIAQATEYQGSSLENAHKIYPAWAVQPLPHPQRAATQAMSFSEAAWIFELRNVDFWGRYGGSIVTADNVLLGDLSPEVWGVENHPIFSQLRLPKAAPLMGRTAIAVTPEAVGNYYHWLIDLLPRVALLREHEQFSSFARLFLNGSRAPYETASLEALRIPAEKISYVGAEDRFRLEHAVLPSFDQGSKVIAPWKIDILRRLRDSMSLGENGRGVQRLYLSRQDAAVRRIANEPELRQILEADGFTCVQPEKLSWTEQIEIFSSARLVVAPHGAALANIVFCRPGTLIVELHTAAGYRDFYLHLAASAGLRYRFVEARPREVSGKSSGIRAHENQDMTVDLPAFQKLLAELSLADSDI